MSARKAKTSHPRKQRLEKEYWAAVAEYHRITKYLKATTGVLSKANRELLMEFAELAKLKYHQLRWAMNRRSAQGYCMIVETGGPKLNRKPQLRTP